jgi:hypothetical protein
MNSVIVKPQHPVNQKRLSKLVLVKLLIKSHHAAAPDHLPCATLNERVVVVRCWQSLEPKQNAVLSLLASINTLLLFRIQLTAALQLRQTNC